MAISKTNIMLVENGWWVTNVFRIIEPVPNKVKYVVKFSLSSFCFPDAEGVEDEGERPLTINHVKISGAEAELGWEGLALSSISKCEYSKSVNNSSTINFTLLEKPNNLTLRLTNLKPSTRYGIILVCYDTKGKPYKSSLTNFQTRKSYFSSSFVCRVS